VPSWLASHAATEQEDRMGRVVIGMDPHKHSATIEVMDDQETVLGGGRFGTDMAGYRAMLGCARRWPERIWAI
jgi:transposase